VNKSTKYLIAVLALLGLNLLVFFSGGDGDAQQAEKYFLSEDLDGVSRFLFVVNEDTTKIERSEQGWTLNDTYAADEGFVNTLISVLERVEAGRTIENPDLEISGNVEVEFDFNSRYRFQFSTNPTKTKTYFIFEGTAKEVAVPGYRDNVADIFTLHPDQWRDRLIVDASWRTIQRVSVQAGNNDFEVRFNDDFFLVDERSPVDSSAVINYLNQFQQFQANEMISPGRFPELDALLSEKEFAQIVIDHLNADQPVTLKIYPDADQNGYHLVTSSQGDQMVIDARRIAQIIGHPDPAN